MNLLDKVILEWSYRTKKGYPDINNEEDMRIFESMFGFNLIEVLDKGYRVLKFSELIKRGAPRLVKFYDMVQSGGTFYNTDGNELKLQFASEEYSDLFKNRDVAGIRKIAGNSVNTFPFFLDSNENSVLVKSLT